MFTPGGQIDRLSFAGLRGGGKGGGGGYQAPTPVAPTVYTDPVSGKSFASSSDLNASIDQRKLDEQAASDAAALKKQQDDQAALDKFNASKSTAYNDALQSVINQFTKQGVDSNQYLESDIKPLLNQKLNSIRDLDPNPAAAFSGDLGGTIINNLVSGKRTQAGAALDKYFSPTYVSSAVPDTLIGQYADTLLNEQFDPLSSQLVNAQKRGTLTPTGYSAALSALSQKRSAARSTIGDLGSSIIAKDRSGLSDYISGARSDANALNLSSMFDPSAYQTGAQNLAKTDIDQFGGALRSAVGGTQFATLGDLINAGGAVQGANNPNAANPVALGVTSTLDEQNKKRGLGSTGAF